MFKHKCKHEEITFYLKFDDIFHVPYSVSAVCQQCDETLFELTINGFLYVGRKSVYLLDENPVKFEKILKALEKKGLSLPKFISILNSAIDILHNKCEHCLQTIQNVCNSVGIKPTDINHVVSDLLKSIYLLVLLKNKFSI